MIAARRALENAGQGEERLRRQIEDSKFHAPGDGLVIHSRDIAEGATVRERQRLFSIVDPGGPMRAVVKVPEAVVDRVAPGQRARVQIDAFPGRALEGEVERVAPRPDPTSWFAQREKVYTTKVRLEDRPPGLRPGLTATVEILGDRPGSP